MRRVRLWLARFWFCWVKREHDWWTQVTYGGVVNYRTGEFVDSPLTERTFCLLCGEKQS